MCWTYYNQAATKIQKTWKGYHVRSTVFNFKEYKEWRLEVIAKNDAVVREMKVCHNVMRELYNVQGLSKTLLQIWGCILHSNNEGKCPYRHIFEKFSVFEGRKDDFWQFLTPHPM